MFLQTQLGRSCARGLQDVPHRFLLRHTTNAVTLLAQMVDATSIYSILSVTVDTSVQLVQQPFGWQNWQCWHESQEVSNTVYFVHRRFSSLEVFVYVSLETCFDLYRLISMYSMHAHASTYA